MSKDPYRMNTETSSVPDTVAAYDLTGKVNPFSDLWVCPFCTMSHNFGSGAPCNPNNRVAYRVLETPKTPCYCAKPGVHKHFQCPHCRKVFYVIVKIDSPVVGYF